MAMLLWVILGIAAVEAALLLLLLLRLRDPAAALAKRLDALETLQQRLQERTERALGAEMARGREESANVGKGLREEVATSLVALGEGTARQLEAMRRLLEERLQALQAENAQKLESMRQVVDEKLQGTLERRLGESFRLVSDRLEQVQKGLGEMQTLASGVGDLKKVLTNVKTRGAWGEIQLGGILEDCFSPTQYAANVATRPGSTERVEFAIRLPGPGDAAQDGDSVWLPIDAKFPQEDYLRLQEAAERGDVDAVQKATDALGRSIKIQAEAISSKYLCPPCTTDFAIMFLPTEGLYAEVLRQPSLTDELQHKYHVMVAGPTTLAALLNSLRMGFQTLAIEQQSAEVWKVLAAVKTEFGKFGDVLVKVKKQLNTAANTIGETERRSRAMERKLRGVESLPESEASQLLELPVFLAEQTEDDALLSAGDEAE